jgi:hypothetical protein
MRIASALLVAAAALASGACSDHATGPSYPSQYAEGTKPQPPAGNGEKPLPTYAAPLPGGQIVPPQRSSAPSVVPAIRPGTSPTRWEYFCAGQESLAEAGAQGWEMISFSPMVVTTTGLGGAYGYTSITTESWYCFRRALP